MIQIKCLVLCCTLDGTVFMLEHKFSKTPHLFSSPLQAEELVFSVDVLKVSPQFSFCFILFGLCGLLSSAVRRRRRQVSIHWPQMDEACFCHISANINTSVHAVNESCKFTFEPEVFRLFHQFMFIDLIKTSESLESVKPCVVVWLETPWVKLRFLLLCFFYVYQHWCIFTEV